MANAAWSKQTTRQEEREKRKDKKDRKRKWLKSQQEAAPSSIPNSSANVGDVEDDWDDLAREEKMAKKLKKGGITQASFDEEFVDL